YFFEAPWTNAYNTMGGVTGAQADALFVINQVFYYANVYHDWQYANGFDEPAGNWQKSNFGRGGKEGDYLYVDAHAALLQGAPTNANMSPPQDGAHPRAQFYVFTRPALDQKASDVDWDVVAHEFTHGLSHRLVGDADSGFCLISFQANAMGEGW